MRTINRIIIHCAATPNGKHFTAADIDKWHKARGWRGIGYHYVITLDGQLEAGRPVEEVGAHVKGMNKDSIGICLIGTDLFTPAQIATLRETIQGLITRFPMASVNGHNEFSNKKCPGFDVQDWLEKSNLNY